MEGFSMSELRIPKETKTTAWKEAKPICEKIIETLMAEQGSEYFSQAPSTAHPYYSEIMEDYIDLTIMQKKLRDNKYMNMFSLKQDMRNIWQKAYTYMKNDPKVIEAADTLR